MSRSAPPEEMSLKCGYTPVNADTVFRMVDY